MSLNLEDLMSWGETLLYSICFLFFWDALSTWENDDSFVEVVDWAMLVFKEDEEDADYGGNTNTNDR